MARYENFTVGNLYVEKVMNQYGSLGVPGANPHGGMDYYVDNNFGADTYDGLSWDTPYKTLAKAIGVSNTYIAANSRGWANRNRIFYKADTETADLVVFPNKCDVIGVGSYDANDKPGITGNHVPVNAGNYGTRFINVWFKAPADASPIVTLASSTSGCQFLGCTFSATATTTIGIQATASPFLKVRGCRFEGAFVTSYITLGAGESGGTEITDNVMVDAAAAGIVINSSATTSWRSLIADNFIQAATLCLDENSDKFYYYNNVFISAAAVTGTAYAEVCDVNIKLGAANYLTADNVVNVLYPYVDTTT